MLAVAEHENIHSDLIPRIATGYCSGIARTGGMCGAVSGAILAIGLRLGRNEPANDIDPCYQATREFLQCFEGKFGGLACLELTGVDLGTPEGQAAFRSRGQIEMCTNYVGEATEMVVAIIGSRME